MPTWEERFAKREPAEPPMTLIETCWRMTGPSGRVFDCGIYQIETGLEVRSGYGPDDLLRSQYTKDVGTAREIGEQWRQAVLAKGGFSEVER